MNYPLYLDYNATTPCDKKVLEGMLPYFTIDLNSISIDTERFTFIPSSYDYNKILKS